MEQLLGFIVLAISLYGYIQFFSKSIKAEFALGVTFASIGCVMFFAGILNVLPTASYAITAVGIFMAISSLKNFKSSVLRIITPGTVFFAVMSIICVFMLKGSIFTGSDAYHHWGTVVDLLIKYDRLPNIDNFNITFPAYPTGVASFIYYFAKTCHADSNWFIIMCQNLLTVGLFTSIFAFAKSKVSYVFTCVAVIAFYCTNEPLTYLTVDNLIAACAVGGIAIAIYYRENLEDKLIYILPYTVFLTSIKNSGILFGIIIAVYCILYIPKTKSHLAKTALFSAAPVFTLVLWQKHVDLLFPKGLEESHHAMSIARFKLLYEEKVQLGIMEQTWDMYCRNVFTVKNVVLFIAAAAIICLVYSLITNKKLNGDFAKLTIFSTVTYVVYQIGLLGTYIFSMPAYEMSNPDKLPSYERYHLTIIVFVGALIYIGALHYLQKSKINSFSNILHSSLLFTVLLLAVFACSPHFDYIKSHKASGDEHVICLRNKLEAYGVPERHSYLIVSDSTFVKYLYGYLLDPTDCKAWDINTLIKYQRYLNNYDYLILDDTSEETRAEVCRLLGGEINSDVILISDYMEQVRVTD